VSSYSSGDEHGNKSKHRHKRSRRRRSSSGDPISANSSLSSSQQQHLDPSSSQSQQQQQQVYAPYAPYGYPPTLMHPHMMHQAASYAQGGNYAIAAAQAAVAAANMKNLQLKQNYHSQHTGGHHMPNTNMNNNQPDPSCRVYIGNINYEFGEFEIRNICERFGPIRHITFAKDPSTQRHKGFCFVDFASPQSAEMAIAQVSGFVLGGRPLRTGKFAQGQMNQQQQHQYQQPQHQQQYQPQQQQQHSYQQQQQSQPTMLASPAASSATPVVLPANHAIQQQQIAVLMSAAASAKSTTGPADGNMSPSAIAAAKGSPLVEEHAPAPPVSHTQQDVAATNASESQQQGSVHADSASSQPPMVPPYPTGSSQQQNVQQNPAHLQNIQNKIYVGSINWNASEADIRSVFGAFGTIVSVKIPMNMETGKHKGHAFLEYSTAESARAAISHMNGVHFMDRNLKVNAVLPKTVLMQQQPQQHQQQPHHHQHHHHRNAPAAVPPPGYYNAMMMQHMAPMGYGVPPYGMPPQYAAAAAAAAMHHHAAQQNNLSAAMQANNGTIGAAATGAPATTGSVEESASNGVATSGAPSTALRASASSSLPPIPQGVSATWNRSIPTRCVRLLNMVTPEKVDEELERELLDECNKYDKVETITIYEDEVDRDIVVKIFILFTTPEGAQKAQQTLDKRFFDGNQIIADFYNEEYFRQGEFRL